MSKFAAMLVFYTLFAWYFILSTKAVMAWKQKPQHNLYNDKDKAMCSLGGSL